MSSALDIRASAEEADVKVLGVVVMPADSSLAVVGKDLNQVFVDEDPQGEVLILLQIEGRLDGADV